MRVNRRERRAVEERCRWLQKEEKFPSGKRNNDGVSLWTFKEAANRLSRKVKKKILSLHSTNYAFQSESA